MGAACDIPCQFSRAWEWGRALAQPRICNNIAVLPASVRSSADCAGQRQLKRRHWLQTVAADAAVSTMKTSVTFSTTRSEEHTSELQSLMSISYAVFHLKKKTYIKLHNDV